MKKKIIITGGLGYIGTELCRLYSGVSWHHNILVIDNRFISERVNQIRNWNMKFIHGDILDKDLVNKHFKKFVSACEFEHYPFEKPFHDIYKKELCISPMPALAVHFTNINSIFGLSPNVDWKQIWDENNL